MRLIAHYTKVRRKNNDEDREFFMPHWNHIKKNRSSNTQKKKRSYNTSQRGPRVKIVDYGEWRYTERCCCAAQARWWWWFRVLIDSQQHNSIFQTWWLSFFHLWWYEQQKLQPFFLFSLSVWDDKFHWHEQFRTTMRCVTKMNGKLTHRCCWVARAFSEIIYSCFLICYSNSTWRHHRKLT